jgi:phage terminase large subunit-like protein
LNLDNISIDSVSQREALARDEAIKNDTNIDYEELLKDASRKELLELVDLTENWASAKDTKFHLYKPTLMAERFHASDAKVRAKFGGNRSSKTYSHIIDYSTQFTGEVPDSLKGTIPEHRLERGRRLRFCMGDYPNSFTKVIWPYIKQLVPQDSISDVMKDSGRIKAIGNKYGGFMEFMQYDQDVTKFQGSSRHSIGYDEEPPQDIRDENLMRLIDTDGEETFSLTPVSGAIKYLYDEVYLKRGREVERNWNFILDNKGKLADAIPGEITDITIPDGDSDIHAFFACIFDNPALTKKAAIRILGNLSEDEVVMRGKGHFLFLSGRVYKAYSDATHLINDFPDWKKDPSFSLYLAMDIHPRINHAVTFMVTRKGDPTLYVVDELWFDHSDNKLRDFAESIQIKCGDKVPEVCLIDPIAYTPDPVNGSKAAYDIMEEFDKIDFSFPIIAGSKDKARGIIKTQEALSLEKGRPNLAFVRDTCFHHRREITHYIWDDWKKADRVTKGEKQVAVDKNDHFMENLRRLVLLLIHHIEDNTPTPDEERHYQTINRRGKRIY